MTDRIYPKTLKAGQLELTEGGLELTEGGLTKLEYFSLQIFLQEISGSRENCNLKIKDSVSIAKELIQEIEDNEPNAKCYECEFLFSEKDKNKMTNDYSCLNGQWDMLSEEKDLLNKRKCNFFQKKEIENVIRK